MNALPITDELFVTNQKAKRDQLDCGIVALTRASLGAAKAER